MFRGGRGRGKSGGGGGEGSGGEILGLYSVNQKHMF